MRKVALTLMLLFIGGAALVDQDPKGTTTPTDPSPSQDAKQAETSANKNALGFGFNEFSVRNDGSTRRYLLYVPKSYTNNTPAPLVIFLHGGLGDMEHAKIYNLQTKAEEGGFLLVLANGVSALPGDRLATWNAGACCDYARDVKSDDVGYIRRIVEDVSDNASVDARRIYAAGMSNGGMMSYRLACEASEIFAAIASVAGTDSTLSCKPSEKVSILHIHAIDDTHVLFNGGAGENAYRDHSKVTNFVSVPESISRWVTYNGLNQKPTRTLDVTGAHCDTYSSHLDETEVTLCVTDTGKHSWPGSTVLKPSQAINANDMIWEFFEKHSK